MEQKGAVLSAEIAATPAGWVAGAGGIIVLFLVPLVIWIFKRLVTELDTVKASLSEQTRALGVLVERVEPVSATLADHSRRLRTLEQETAVLRSINDRHEKWAAQEHERNQTEHANLRASITGPVPRIG